MGTNNFDPQERRTRHRRNELIMKCIISFLVLAIVAMSFVMVRVVVIPEVTRRTSASVQAQASAGEDNLIETENEVAVPAVNTENSDTNTAESADIEAVLAKAENLAVMYDYDGAISAIQSSEYFETNETLQSALSGYETERDACVSWDPENVTHIFFHTLIKDPSLAFDGDSDAEGYNQYMVTVDEFASIMQIMYEEGYVMVSMHDMCTVNEDGTVTPKTIQLPAGKIPFVLSQDDVSYYHYMCDDGFAQKLVLDENGDVKCKYVGEDGTISIGDYDLIPWIDTFVESHPDFSYHGHKGTIALTGYEGVLGYRTDEVYRTREADRLTSYQETYLEANPDFDWQEEVDAATEIATVMKENGWEFASHTWGHIDPLAKGYDATVKDTERWLENVEPIIGPTDIIIFAFGADIADWQEYEADNQYYTYFKSQGFDIFCNVDSSQYWVQFNGTSMRMGRRNIDGYRMYYNPDLLSDLFDVSEVWDDARPSSVASLDGSGGSSSSVSASAESAEESSSESAAEAYGEDGETYENADEGTNEGAEEASDEGTGEAAGEDSDEFWITVA